jgi:TRAP-type mannitol/chloroaromatic compound transport system permease small subunit
MGRERKLESVPFADDINHLILKVGEILSWVYALLIVVILMQVILRKGFSNGLIVLEELQWHLYAIGVMMGLSYSQVNDSHVRVDLFYDRYSPRVRHVIEILGMLFFVFPMLFVVIYHSMDFVKDSFRIMESSVMSSGLPYRYLIKSIIPISLTLLGVACLTRLYSEIVLLIQGNRSHGA